LIPGPLPPPVAGAPTGAPVVTSGVADVVVPLVALVDVLGVVAVPVADAVPARAAGQTSVPAGVAVEVAGVQSLQCGWVPLASGSHAIGVPFAATPDMFRSALGQNSPAL